MRRFPHVLVAALLIGGCSQVQTDFDYPVAREGDVVDNYHGVTVADP